jgi:beta-galactosidase
MAIRVDSNGLYLDGRRIPLYSGSVHYWRYSPNTWPTLLERIKELGFEIIQSPVPWGLHESGPGIFDFGEKNPQKGLPQFLDLCTKAGILAILRPGPFVGEDMPFGGFPLRVIRNSAVWALTSTGAPALSTRYATPFAIPSYASERFLHEVGKFLDALAPVLVSHQYPDGPVILCQMNKESAFMGRTQAYDLDYCPESITLFRNFLSEKYGAIENLNTVYATKYSAYSEISAPKRCEATVQRDLPVYLDWVEYKEYLIRRFYQRLGGMFRDRGISVPLSIDGPSIFSTPMDSIGLQKSLEITLTGMEVDPNSSDYPALARQIRYLTGTSKLPFVSKFGSGNSWFAPRVNTPHEEEFAILSAVMHGMTAVNFHMLAEGDRWVGAPISRDGAFREEFADLFRHLQPFFAKYGVWESKKNCRTLVVLSYELERYHLAVSTMNYAYLGLIRIPAIFSEVSIPLGFQIDPARQSIYEEGSWIQEACRFLENAQVEYNLSDSHQELDEMAKYDMVFLPTADFMDLREQEKFLEFADRGGHLVFGPGLPTLDGRMNPGSVLKNAIQIPGTQTRGAGKITYLPTFDAAKELITADMPNVVLLDNPNLRLTIRGGSSNLIFLANPTGVNQRSMMISSWPLRGVWNAPEETQTGSVTTEIGPHTVQVWEVLK